MPRCPHVAANQEYYQQWSLEEGEPCAMDMSTYTLEELEHITSEYTLRNQVSAARALRPEARPAPPARCRSRAHSCSLSFLPRIPSPWLSLS